MEWPAHLPIIGGGGVTVGLLPVDGSHPRPQG